MSQSPSRGWHRRGYLPHLDVHNRCQAITYRLADSVPTEVVEKWRAQLLKNPDADRDKELKRLIARYEDEGHGDCWLHDPHNAEIVEENLQHFDGDRYQLLEWCIMPNHVHVLIKVTGQRSLEQVVRSWKSFTAREINHRIHRKGQFWSHDYFDRLIRDDEHLSRARKYIWMNRVKAGLCKSPEDWRFSSARIT